MRAFLRFLLAEPAGSPSDGRAIGLGLSTALRRQGSADDAERYLRLWATPGTTSGHDVHESPRH
ncbi:hypothetical protein ACBR40_31335 [Nonomuraea sp. AD125B]|uniref:hypothetical protein n=1 Tax=Nonomuraea TaxID=83681 RepID=UPI0031D1ECAB